MLVNIPLQPLTYYYQGKTGENYLWSHLPVFCCPGLTVISAGLLSPVRSSNTRQLATRGHCQVGKSSTNFYFPSIALCGPWWPLVTRSVLATRREAGSQKYERRAISRVERERGPTGLAVTSSSMFPVFAIIPIILVLQAETAKCSEQTRNMNISCLSSATWKYCRSSLVKHFHRWEEIPSCNQEPFS